MTPPILFLAKRNFLKNEKYSCKTKIIIPLQKMHKYKISCLILLGLIEINAVLAYIDPGTGGMIIGGGVWPFIVAMFAAIAGFSLKYFFKPIKRGVKSVWGRIKGKN